MPKFEVDEDFARRVERLANPKPFENLTFSNALRRVLDRLLRDIEPGATDLGAVSADAGAGAEAPQPKKAQSPSAKNWAASVPELKRKTGLTNWRAICDHLGIETAGDSARRKLKGWVKENKPAWPEVPEIGTD